MDAVEAWDWQGGSAWSLRQTRAWQSTFPLCLPWGDATLWTNDWFVQHWTAIFHGAARRHTHTHAHTHMHTHTYTHTHTNIYTHTHTHTNTHIHTRDRIIFLSCKKGGENITNQNHGVLPLARDEEEQRRLLKWVIRHRGRVIDGEREKEREREMDR